MIKDILISEIETAVNMRITHFGMLESLMVFHIPLVNMRGLEDLRERLDIMGLLDAGSYIQIANAKDEHNSISVRIQLKENKKLIQELSQIKINVK